MQNRVGTFVLVFLVMFSLFLVPALPVLMNQCPVYSTCPYPGKAFSGMVSPTYFVLGTGGSVSDGRYHLSLAPHLNPLYGDPGPSISVVSVDSQGNTLTGFYVVLYDGSGHVLSTGYSPVTFSQLNAGERYTVQPQGFGGCTFRDWFDNTDTGAYRTLVATETTTTLYAIFNGTCP